MSRYHVQLVEQDVQETKLPDMYSFPDKFATFNVFLLI